MKISKIRTLFFFVIVFSALIPSHSPARENLDQHVIVFNDGSKVLGRIIKMNSDIVKIQIADGRILIRKFDDVVTISDIDQFKETSENEWT